MKSWPNNYDSTEYIRIVSLLCRTLYVNAYEEIKERSDTQTDSMGWTRLDVNLMNSSKWLKVENDLETLLHTLFYPAAIPFNSISSFMFMCVCAPSLPEIPNKTWRRSGFHSANTHTSLNRISDTRHKPEISNNRRHSMYNVVLYSQLTDVSLFFFLHQNGKKKYFQYNNRKRCDNNTNAKLNSHRIEIIKNGMVWALIFFFIPFNYRFIQYYLRASVRVLSRAHTRTKTWTRRQIEARVWHNISEAYKLILLNASCCWVHHCRGMGNDI